MNLKKMLLLASMALAAMAFGAPAAQANIDWNKTGTIEGTGELSSLSETGLTTGPAEVHFVGNVVKGSTTAEITAFEITTGPNGIPTNVPGCHAEGHASGFPWVVHLETPDTMTITDVTFTNTYTAPAGQECVLPPAVPVDGDVTLTVEKNEAGQARCADAEPYKDFGTLGVEPETSPGVDIEGTVCWTGPAITGI
jgi:hypothetical protein